ncbi:hypothetical protein F7725_009310 [Dissostichus mawsoni]|uniref:Uncharacterized protein n=1 Tax=Dissostichus mawsoni TaxID=36200 RepID=A0A7J5Z8H8_DISMA|nr:hypothetical protein F7725_009310 [Dissostichus mawsoni]
MSDRYFEILRDSRQSWNDIPAGRQLLRTPPCVKQQLRCCSKDSTEEQVEPQMDMEAYTTVEDDNDQQVTFNYNAITPKQNQKNLTPC